MQLKLQEAINLDLEDKKALADITKRAIREGRVEQYSEKKLVKDGQLGADGRECQRTAQLAFYQGKQRRL